MDKTLNLQMNEERQSLERETPRHTSSGNQDTSRLSRPQQEALVLRASGLNAVIRGSQDVNAQFSYFYIKYTNYD